MNNRYDFVYLFDCKDGNPNGDPDAANSPRIDPQDMHGLVSDVCLKRKIRNFALLAKSGQPPFDIFVQQGSVLNDKILEGHQAAGNDVDGKKKTADRKQVQSARSEMCKRFYDVRTFGAVMSTGAKHMSVKQCAPFGYSQCHPPNIPSGSWKAGQIHSGQRAWSRMPHEWSRCPHQSSTS